MFKNTASQKLYVKAIADAGHASLDAGEPVTGDAAQITGKLSLDYAAAGAITDTNPTEIEDGVYVFDLTQAETNADVILPLPESSTAGVQVIALPNVIYTRPPNFSVLGIESDGDLTKVNLCDTTTTNTDMRGTDSAALASVCTEGRLAELDAANLPADVDTLLTRITSTLFSGITSLAEWLGLIAGKQTPDATAQTEIRATGAGSGTYDATADSQEAIRDRGDVSWITATGFSTLDAAGIRTAVGLASANLDTQLQNLGFEDGFVYFDPENGNDSNPGTISSPKQSAHLAYAASTNKKIKCLPNGVPNSNFMQYLTGTMSDLTLDLNGRAIDKANNSEAFGTGADCYVFSSGAQGHLYGGYDPSAPTSPLMIDLGTGNHFENILIENAKFSYAYFVNCSVKAALKVVTGGGVNVLTGVYFTDNNGSDAELWLGSADTNKVTEITDFWGNFEVRGLKSTQRLYALGWGQVTLNADCTGGTIFYSSHVDIVDNSGGAVTKTLYTEGTSEVATAVWAAATRTLTAGTNLNDISAADVNAQVLDVLNTDTLIDGKTIVTALRIGLGVMAGKISGAGTGSEVFRSIDDGEDVATVTVDASGNRTAVTYGI